MALWRSAPAVYEAANLYRERCLVAGVSLLWPDEPAWTPESIDALLDAYIGRPDEGKRTFLEKWREQLADQPRAVHQVAADVIALYLLFPASDQIGPVSKMATLRTVLEWRLADDQEPPDLPILEAAFAQGIGNAGTWYLTGRPWQIAFYLRFARRLLAEGVDTRDQEACQRLADAVLTEDQSAIAARHVLLHLLFPDRYERIASDSHKRQIVGAYQGDAGAADDVDAALLNIRQALTTRLGRAEIDFYEPDIRRCWGTVIDPPPPPPPNGKKGNPPSLTDLAAVTHLDPVELEEIKSLLEEKRQLIFEGPPGSGKTYVAELFARWFVGAPLWGPPEARVELVQFHQLYGYEDFVQGIRPETDPEGRLRYRVRDGIFKRLCGLAASQPDRRFVLVIDEVNRGNVARIFGELLLLLEYRDKRARLPYAAADDGDDAYLTVPDNLFLIGTMNSTDRSLSQVDYALRRRFYFRRFMPVVDGQAPVLDGWLQARAVAPEHRRRLVRLFVALNHRVEELLSPDFQVGHSYFMTPGIDTEAGLTRVWRRAISPLLEEYLHHHRDREHLLCDLQPDRLLATVHGGGDEAEAEG